MQASSHNRMRALLSTALLCSVLFAGLPSSLLAQIPDEFTNLQVLPEDISRDDLMSAMRGFSMALGVRCQHCHESDGPSFGDTDFPSDALPAKEKARFMLRMLSRLNDEVLPSMENREDPPVVMTCKTCHRGTTRPFLLSQELTMAAHEGGGSAAVARYRELRDRYEISGAYDFGEIETAEVADQLAAEGRYEDALALLELNVEMHPESSNVLLGLGTLHQEMGNTERAIEAFEKALELGPNNRRAQMMLQNVRGDQ